MTNLSIRKANKEELQTLIDYEMQAYAITVQGRDNYIDASNGRPTAGDFNHYGAIEIVTATNAPAAMNQVQEKIDQGFRLYTGAMYALHVTPVFLKFYIVKSEALQAEDAKQIAKEVEAKYTAEIDAHNEKVFAQVAQALKVEEAAVAAQLKREDEARAAQDFEKRVRERMRGSKVGAK